jgi:uncharacterized lipoprotein YmbA
VACLLLATVLCGCRAPPVRWYVLSVVHPGSGFAVQGHRGGITPVRVERVRLPSELDRSQIVRRMDANRLQVEANSRWAAPLNEMIRRVLSGDLEGRLAPGMVMDPYQSAPAGQVRSLSLDVHELYGDARCAVSLRVTWVLNQPQDRVQGATEDIHVPPSGRCPEAQAAAMSQALGALSDRIAAAITPPHS